MAASSIQGLDSRAVAALLKELAKTGQGARAHEFFEYILGLGDQHEAARLCDVFTYTAAISICNNDQQVRRALPSLSSLAPCLWVTVSQDALCNPGHSICVLRIRGLSYLQVALERVFWVPARFEQGPLEAAGRSAAAESCHEEPSEPPAVPCCCSWSARCSCRRTCRSAASRATCTRTPRS